MAALALFARPVVAGSVKTRLSATLGTHAAAELYGAFITDTVRAVMAEPQLAPRLWVAGDPSHESLAQLPASIPRARQPDGDLGARMAVALERGLREHGAAIALGTDSPTLPTSYLARALPALEHAPLVLGPAADGGYYLLATRDGSGRLRGVLSGVRWSTRHALQDTVAAAERAGLGVRLLPPWYDVDTVRDLALLRLHLSLRPGDAPATAAALEELARRGRGATPVL